MDNDTINLQNRITNLEIKIIRLESELSELRKDIIRARIIPMTLKPTMVMDAHDDLG